MSLACTTMKDEEQYYYPPNSNSNSPDWARELNASGLEMTHHGQVDGDYDDAVNHHHSIRMALQLHREALAIFEWNKRHALLFDHAEQSKDYAVEMACTLSKIGNLLRKLNDFVGAAEAYKESLDNFLEGLIDGGAVFKRKLLECEYEASSRSSSSSSLSSSDATYQTLLNSVDRTTIGTTLSHHPEFRLVIQNISQLICEMLCIKFVGGQNAASSRRRRRMVQYAAREENLKNAVKSLSSVMTTPTATTTSSSSALENHIKDSCRDGETNRLLRSKSLPTATSDDGIWTRQFWNKSDAERLLVSSRPRPLLRRALTSDEEYDQYQALSTMILPVEKSLLAALNRFPLPAGIVEDDITATTATTFSLPSSSSSTTVEEDGAMIPPQLSGGQDDALSRDEVSERVSKSQNPIDDDASFLFPSMTFVLSMNCGSGGATTSTSPIAVDDDALAHHIPQKLRVGLPLMC